MNLKKVLIFVIGLFLIDFIIFILVIYGSSFFKNVDHTLTLQHPDSDILILGASHARESFSPEQLQKQLGLSAFNLGGPGHNPLFMRYQSELLISENKRPKAVILTVTYDSLKENTIPHVISPFIQEGAFAHTLHHFASQRNFKEARSFFLTDLYSLSARVLLSRSVSWIKNRTFEVSMPHLNDRGFVCGEQELSPGPRPDQIPKINFRFNQNMIDELNLCIQAWREVNVPVFIIDTHEFIGTRLGRHEYGQYMTIMKNLSQHPNVVFKSFNTLEQNEQTNPSFFRDGGWGVPNSHLNLKGATWFNQRFCEWLKTQTL